MNMTALIFDTETHKLHGDIIEAAAIEVIFPEFTNEGNVPLKYLAKSLEAIADVDVVYFIHGWNDARGCKIEYECCKAYGIPTIETHTV